MDIVAKIVASKADVVLVAMGNPAQETWLAENLAATGCRLGFGVGALFDFLSGDVVRAPRWVRAVRMEWVYRLFREPGRLWRRYLLGNPMFLMRVLGQWWCGARV
jgi:alpha-1,3-mannosyltransferase